MLLLQFYEKRSYKYTFDSIKNQFFKPEPLSSRCFEQTLLPVTLKPRRPLWCGGCRAWGRGSAVTPGRASTLAVLLRALSRFWQTSSCSAPPSLADNESPSTFSQNETSTVSRVTRSSLRTPTRIPWSECSGSGCGHRRVSADRLVLSGVRWAAADRNRVKTHSAQRYRAVCCVDLVTGMFPSQEVERRHVQLKEDEWA